MNRKRRLLWLLPLGGLLVGCAAKEQKRDDVEAASVTIDARDLSPTGSESGAERGTETTPTPAQTAAPDPVAGPPPAEDAVAAETPPVEPRKQDAPAPDDAAQAGADPVPAATPDPVAEPPLDEGAVVAETSPAEPRKEAAPDPCDQWHVRDEAMVDKTRRNLEETVCGAALWFDGLFGEQRNIEAARGVRGKLETSIAYSDFYGFKTRTRFLVRADLPNMKQRVSAFIGRDNDEDFVRDRSEGFGLREQFPNVADQDEWLAGLGYSLPGNKRFQSDFRIGVRNIREPRAFVQSRLRYNAYADFNDTFDLRLTPFYNSRDGFGITPGADYSHVLTPKLLGRISLTGTRTEQSEGLDWRNAYILYQGLTNGRGLAYEAFIRGLTGAEVGLREYGLQAVYRQPLVRRKLFGEFLVGYTWPKEEEEEQREGSYLVGFNLELPFGKDKKKPE